MKMKQDRFLIVTGMSGSGKTVASRILEDFGYYCVDNLPAKLIPIFINLRKKREFEIDKVALIIDIREANFSTEFPKILKSIRENELPRVIFMEASDEVIVKRFSESRRPHPLKRKHSIWEKIELERKSLEEIRNLADDVIDTTTIKVTELRKILAKRFVKKAKGDIQIVIISFGYRYGIPVDSDLVFDVRFLPNPYYVEGLRDKTGENKSVRDYVLNFPGTKVLLKQLFMFIDYLMPNFVAEGKSYLTISIGCTGGKHRSVTIANELRDHLVGNKFSSQVNHKDIYK
jgi:UPF0042 nucleotide-binding protein